MVREERLEEIEDRAELAAEERLLEMLLMHRARHLHLTQYRSRMPYSSSDRTALSTRQPLPGPTDATAAGSATGCAQQFRDGRSTTGSWKWSTRDRGQPMIEIFTGQPAGGDG